MWGAGADERQDLGDDLQDLNELLSSGEGGQVRWFDDAEVAEEHDEVPAILRPGPPQDWLAGVSRRRVRRSAVDHLDGRSAIAPEGSLGYNVRRLARHENASGESRSYCKASSI